MVEMPVRIYGDNRFQPLRRDKVGERRILASRRVACIHNGAFARFVPNYVCILLNRIEYEFYDFHIRFLNHANIRKKLDMRTIGRVQSPLHPYFAPTQRLYA